MTRYLRGRSLISVEGSRAVSDGPRPFRKAFSAFSSASVFSAFSRLPSAFASQSDSPVGAPREFGSTEHLSTEAIAAFVDGELRMSAHLRAAHHLSQCAECALDIDAQRQARSALRDSGAIRVPGSLLGLLSQIPHIPDPNAQAAPRSDVDMPPALAGDEVRRRRKRR